MLFPRVFDPPSGSNYSHRLFEHPDEGTLFTPLEQEGKGCTNPADPSWRPGPYREKLWKGVVYFGYPICKLLDFESRADRPLFGNNPAAILVASHLAAQRTRGNMGRRLKLKWILVRRLYKGGYDVHTIRELFRLIDWDGFTVEQRS